MMCSTASRWRDLLALGRPPVQHVGQDAAPHLQRAAGHDVVERRHALEQGDVLEGAGDALAGGEVGAHVVPALALEGDHAFLRVIEAVDDVEHRRLAGAVRADDGADLALADVEGDVAQRLDAAERQRHVLERQQNVAGRARRLRPAATGLGSTSAFIRRPPAAARRRARDRSACRRCARRPRPRPCGRPRRSFRWRRGTSWSRRRAP